MARRQPPPNLIGSGLIPGQFQEQYNAAEEDYQGGLAGLGRDERNLFQDYGFQGGVGASGAVNFGVDPNNQFGQYQGLLRQIGGQLGQAKQEVKGRGLGRSGLAKARENLIRFMMSGEKANLATGFNKAAGDIFGKRGGALTTRNRRFSDLEGGALEWWNQYGPDDPDGTIPEGGSAGPVDSGPFDEGPAASLALSGNYWPGAGGYTGAVPPDQLAELMYGGTGGGPAGEPLLQGNQGMVADPNWPDSADPYAPVPTFKPRQGGSRAHQFM